jgi:hypothetical protein
LELLQGFIAFGSQGFDAFVSQGFDFSLKGNFFKIGSRRMGFTGWGMVKGVGHGGGAMGWRGGGEVVIGGSSRRYQWKPKNKKSKKKAAGLW